MQTLGPTKVPLSWGAGQESKYSFRKFLKYLSIWDTATEIEADRRGAVIAVRLTGAAKEIARELGSDTLRNGMPDPKNALRQRSGLEGPSSLRNFTSSTGSLRSVGAGFAASDPLRAGETEKSADDSLGAQARGITPLAAVFTQMKAVNSIGATTLASARTSRTLWRFTSRAWAEARAGGRAAEKGNAPGVIPSKPRVRR